MLMIFIKILIKLIFFINKMTGQEEILNEINEYLEYTNTKCNEIGDSIKKYFESEGCDENTYINSIVDKINGNKKYPKIISDKIIEVEKIHDKLYNWIYTNKYILHDFADEINSHMKFIKKEIKKIN